MILDIILIFIVDTLVLFSLGLELSNIEAEDISKKAYILKKGSTILVFLGGLLLINYLSIFHSTTSLLT